MRIPTRRSDKIPRQKADGRITEAKYRELENERERLLKMVRPRLIEEVKRLASDGDFSENAAYQIAKGRLRGINQRLLNVEDLLKRSEIIHPSANRETVQIGHEVTIEAGGKQRIYQILGSAESDPAGGIISANSPLGAALLGRRAGEIVATRLAGKTLEYKIIKIG